MSPAYYYAQLFKIDRFLIRIKIDQIVQKKQSDSKTFFLLLRKEAIELLTGL